MTYVFTFCPPRVAWRAPPSTLSSGARELPTCGMHFAVQPGRSASDEERPGRASLSGRGPR
eukprot:1255498-Pyramimonas_sp.AAC.1